jgi:multicomponent Na+:H+ antiporter subunit E
VASGRILFAGLRRLALFLVMWWALAEGDTSGWLFALAVALLASASSLALLPPPRWRFRWLAAPRFLGFFLTQMFLGGFDVARRVLHPKLPLAPGLLEYRTDPKYDAALLLLSSSICLLPGTVSVQLRGSVLEVHVLDTRLPVVETIAGLEERIDALFG